MILSGRVGVYQLAFETAMEIFVMTNINVFLDKYES
jgi:hypothetical protein